MNKSDMNSFHSTVPELTKSNDDYLQFRPARKTSDSLDSLPENRKVVSFSDREQVHYNFNVNSFKTFFCILIMLFMPSFVLALNDFIFKYNLNSRNFFNNFTNESFIKFITKLWRVNLNKLLYTFITITLYSIFQIILMKYIPGEKVYGPVTNKGNKPVYINNGFSCYLITMLVFILISVYLEKYTTINISIVYNEFHTILVCLNIIGFIFCIFLYIKGKISPSTTDNSSSDNFIFDYYWGTELYPRIFDIDIKVFTNCRFGMTIWPILLICFLRKSLLIGTNYGIIVNVVLQMFYITKFFWWESGYYNTLDIILDRAGFYICWGCIVFVPGFYTLSTYSMVNNITKNSQFYHVAFVLGAISLVLNYWADYQKQIFREKGGDVYIWGKPAKYIEATFIDASGHYRKSLLLTSGFWGLSRHFNYLAELVLAFCWCGAAGFSHIVPMFYFIFLTILLIHRTERDDSKCTAKYGDFYRKYKSIVKYKIIPFIY